jgi:lipid II:glycine glycyltransferase (peptidoglycan interpeptide bridge formation enzyme)
MNSKKIQTEVLTDNFAKWDYLYSLLPDEIKSPFFTRQYYESYLEIEKGTIECFCCYLDEENFLFYPYLRKDINSVGYDLPAKFYDIAGAYGYNGPIGKVSEPDFVQYFNASLKNYLQQSNVVTEFVRYCPIINNRIFHTYTNQIDVLDNVYIDLSKGIEDVWSNSFEHRVRTAIKKAYEYPLSIQIINGYEINNESLIKMYNIYIDTMQKNLAEDFYFFDINFFSRLVEKLNKNILLIITYFNDLPISTELILIGPKIAYGFLGGTLKEYYQYKANTYQRWELIKHLVNRGIEKYSLGGSISRDDSIYKFKKSFAKNCINPFYIGTYVHQPDIYEIIQSQWKERYPDAATKYANKIQGYRQLA